MRHRRIAPGDRVRWIPAGMVRCVLGVAIARGRDGHGIYVEVLLDNGEKQRIHPSQLELVPDPEPIV